VALASVGVVQSSQTVEVPSAKTVVVDLLVLSEQDVASTLLREKCEHCVPSE
jgi:hypothetical protein